MTMTPEQATWFSGVFGRLVANVEQVLLGKTFVIRLAFTALLSEGHLLLEDFPGTGKTSLARAIAQSVEGVSNRVQFTPDLLPGDITGVSIYDQRSGEFEFHKGPIFANIVLADEINRASPKTQAALLEVMEEGRVTVDGVTHPVGAPFMVIATQNPIEQAGTYRLPEAQLDRFIMKTSIGYPDHASTLRILDGAGVKAHDVTVPTIAVAAVIVEMGRLARTVHVDPSINDYVSRLVDGTRTATEVRLGRQRARRARPGAHREDPRRRKRPALRDPRRREGARGTGARPPAGARPRGRVRRRHGLQRDRPGAHRDVPAERQAAGVSLQSRHEPQRAARVAVPMTSTVSARLDTTLAATQGLTNARTRIVGDRTGFLADAIVAVVRLSAR